MHITTVLIMVIKKHCYGPIYPKIDRVTRAFLVSPPPPGTANLGHDSLINSTCDNTKYCTGPSLALSCSLMMPCIYGINIQALPSALNWVGITFCICDKIYPTF